MHRADNQDDETRSYLILPKGTRIGHYQVIEEIGSGGMGEVYLAEDTELGRRVALKFLRSDICRDEGCRARFRREAQVAAKLNHPNIVTIYEVSEYQGRPFLVMEMVEGRDCHEVIKCGELDLESIVDFAIQICEGLNEAHNSGIIHRDIKPSNVILDSKGRCRLLDFGLAAMLGSERQTPQGVAIGTVGYMSPEQVNGRQADNRSDIFSLGIVLYEMITGRQPFLKETVKETFSAIAQSIPEPLARYKVNVPTGLQKIIDKALDKNPEMRYQHVGDMLTDFKRIKRELAIPGFDSTDFYAAMKLPRRRLWIGLSALAAILIIMSAILIAVPSARRAVFRTFGIKTVPARKYLAVLPFTNIGHNDANQAFCDGLMETMTSKITQLEQFQDSFWVIPASEVRERSITSVNQAKRAFGITLAITGGVQLTGSDVRMTLNLIDAINGRQLNSIVIDAPLSNVAALQDSTVLELAEVLELQVMPEERHILALGGTTDPEAYELYIKACGYLQQSCDVENIDTSIFLFKLALEKDSAYAMAYADLGRAYWEKYQISNDPGWIEFALDNCRHSIAVSNRVVASHVILGSIYKGTGKYEDAIDEFKLAIDIDPSSHKAYRELADTYVILNRIEEARATYEEVIKLKPDYWTAYYDLGLFYLYIGRPDDAFEQMEMVMKLLPESDSDYNNVGALYFYNGRWDDARSMWEKSLMIEPNYGAYSNLGSLHFMEHRFNEAAVMYEKAIGLDSTDYQVWANLASVYDQIPGKAADAEAAYRKAIGMAEELRKVNPRDPELLANLAECSAVTGDSARALSLIEQSLELAPENIIIMARAGVVYEKLGFRDKALNLIMKALDGGYPFTFVKCLPELQGLLADSRFENHSGKGSNNPR
ncbi:MAG: protein kinase [Candidatus Zixiibacteriota bacterium]